MKKKIYFCHFDPSVVEYMKEVVLESLPASVRNRFSVEVRPGRGQAVIALDVTSSDQDVSAVRNALGFLKTPVVRLSRAVRARK